MRTLKKKHLSRLTTIYIIIVFGSVVLWGLLAQDANGLIEPKEARGALWIFAGLFLLGIILAGISFAGVKGDSTMVSKRTVISGITIGIVFLIWRLSVSLF